MVIDVKQKLNELGIKPTRGMGQNFLQDDNIAKKIVRSARLTKKDKVLEIGPGLGVLTDFILESAGELVIVEKDRALASYLEGRYSDDDVKVINKDILDMDLPRFDKVISNLPFSISSPITFKLLKEDFERGILTYQKQFAERMVADVGEKNYSRLTVMTSVYADATILFDIPKHHFCPPPEVDASVVELLPSEPEININDKDFFSKVVKELFNYRRKTIKNALKTGLGKTYDDVPYKKKRVDNLDIKKIGEIVNHVKKNL